MGNDTSFRLYVWQRATAVAMVPFIAVHLVGIFYATRHHVTAADILARTRGSVVWALFYATFVVLAAIHGAIGVRSVLADWTGMSDRARDAAMGSFGILLAALGLRAVAAVIWPGAL